MANHLDLEEQEQLDQLKHFWKQYGNLITWALTLVLGLFAGWNVYQRWQTNQASQASALFDEVERTVKANDLSKVDRVWADMKDKFPSTVYAEQAGLAVAKAYFEAAKIDEAKAALNWVADKSGDDSYRTIAKLRLAGVLIETKAYDDALKLLEGSFAESFAPLVADRKGDILALQGKKPEARAQYEKAYTGFDETTQYRRLVEVKLNAMGVNPRPEVVAKSAEASK
jgi:predicted negative regulator of RcsB-dependent stress response